MSNNWTVFSDKDDKEVYNNNSSIIWEMSEEQLKYYIDQFYKIVPTNNFLLEGFKAKEYFELSKLNISDLRNIWELADNDKDGCLSLGEFCVAMHLVVMRKRGIDVPSFLPLELQRYFYLNNNLLINRDELMVDTNPNLGRDLSKKLPSDTSVKSDSLSLAESITAFDSQPPKGISNPRPMKLPARRYDHVSSKPTGPTDLIQPDQNLQVDPFNEEEEESIVSPPVPPPRCGWTRKDMENLSHTQSAEGPFKTDAAGEEPLLTSQLSGRPYNIDFSQSPENIIIHLNSISDSETRKAAFNFLISTLKMQCDTLTSTNSEMSKNLKELQQHRISLEIQLERMMPIKYN